MNPIQQEVVDAFVARHGRDPHFVIRAPGRVNLIGEHTDYNDGFVLPLAIDRAIWFAIQPRSDDVVLLHSLDMDSTVTFDLTDLRHSDDGWGEYVKGVAAILQKDGYKLAGWEGVMKGDIPIGAGLSSSAALELATARAFAAVGDWPWQPAEMAKVGQRTENEWIGVNCGIMDQMISACGSADHALLIDCRSLDTRAVPLPTGTQVVVLDTATRRGLVDSAYNERRRQCEDAAAYFKVAALRDVDEALFDAKGAGLDALTQQRARHVVTENARTLAAAEAMAADDAQALGALMDASHVSMRDDFEISAEGLNAMVEIARAQPGCYGARMTGGGFGGCAVALVDSGQVEAFVSAVAEAYSTRMKLTPAIYVCSATDGAEII